MTYHISENEKLVLTMSLIPLPESLRTFVKSKDWCVAYDPEGGEHIVLPHVEEGLYVCVYRAEVKTFEILHLSGAYLGDLEELTEYLDFVLDTICPEAEMLN